jgi:hypothetical protein
MTFSFVAHHFRALGQVPFRSLVIALSDGHKDCIKDVELSDAGGAILAEEWGTARSRISEGPGACGTNFKRPIAKTVVGRGDIPLTSGCS